MLPQHSGRSMVPSRSDLAGWSHVWPASRFWSSVMVFRSPRPGKTVAMASGATVGPGGAAAVAAGAAGWLDVDVNAARAAHATRVRTARLTNAYDSTTPASARFRP